MRASAPAPLYAKKQLPHDSNGKPVPPTALDANYVWASATAFKIYGGAKKWYLAALEMPRPKGAPEASFQAHCDAVFAGCSGVTVHPAWWNARFVYTTAMLDAAGLQALQDAAVAGVVSRFEVALAPEPSRPAGGLRTLQPAVQLLPPAQCQEDVLLGAVDYGCPFASTRLRIAGGTRVLDFWEQDGVFQVPNGGAPTKWKFGFSATHVQLNAVTGATPPGDDWALYLGAGLPELCADASHGANLLGCLLGANANSSLLWDKVYDRVPTPLPPRTPATPDVVFVQLPSSYVQGVPRGALAPYRLAGLRYIVECAGRNTQRIVVPLSSENYEGSHDGQSLFDQACDALVDFTKTVLHKTLKCFMAGGNTLRSNVNDRVTLAPGAAHDFTVRVLPGNERYTLVELWVPHALDAVQFDLHSPSGAAGGTLLTGDGVWSSAGQPPIGIVSLRQPSAAGVQRCVTFFIPPTQVTKGEGAEVGDWRISVVAPAGAGGEACTWIARSTPGLGGKARSYQSTFPRRYSWDWDFVANVPSNPAAARPYDDSSLSGLATGGAGTIVGGYRLRSGERALYSGGGPGRPPSVHVNFRLNCSGPSDVSRTIPGILGWGNRSAGFVRLAGTSVATPFVARVYARTNGVPTGAPVGRSDPPVSVAAILP